MCFVSRIMYLFSIYYQLITENTTLLQVIQTLTLTKLQSILFIVNEVIVKLYTFILNTRL
jgi:hypothetical protein